MFDETTRSNLQLQFEELILRGIRSLLQRRTNAAYQFMVGWPTKSLSTPNLWRIVVMLQNPVAMEFDYNSDVQYWRRQLLNVQVG